MMPTAEERHRDAARRHDALFTPRPEDPTPPPPEPLAVAEANAARWWARDRAARIRRGACPVCAERLCPRVGGRDVACVVG